MSKEAILKVITLGLYGRKSRKFNEWQALAVEKRAERIRAKAEKINPGGQDGR
jgi:hypothetical protein